MKFTQRLSLRVRLTLIFLILASVTWLLSSFVAWKQTTDNVDELFDTQLMLFAKRLSTLDLNEINAADRMAQTPNRLKHGHVDDDALTIVAGQLIPWLVALPIMLIIMMVLLGRELAPLNKLALALRMRDPDSEKPLNATGVPSEVRPLVESLNQLFARTHAMMVRERRFTSDAAHELRSPLTALKVQTEVAQLSDDDPQARKKALLQLHSGIDRATRLVDQLLTLSRLDSLDNLQDVAEIPLEDLLQSSVMDIYHTAQQAKIDVRLTLNAHSIKRTGQPLLLSLLVRNLLDNAVRYSPQGSVVDVTLNADNFIVRDNGPGVTPEALARIGERFYRPPGQTATGSGLGLSIVQRIAKLHGMNVEFGNAEQGGFEAKVSW
ncbi:quorum sensing histidine kinase QseC [Escherichia coli]|uniref:quorum sensing histidine kinase QseC n=1 Tax=Escherichia coli TaxID=562 RepID=UPI000D6E0223|nr:quorum sensing histidine kinase QseC [Escherichia coli]